MRLISERMKMKVDMNLFDLGTLKNITEALYKISESIPSQDFEGEAIPKGDLPAFTDVLSTQESIIEILDAMCKGLKRTYGVSENNPLPCVIKFEDTRRMRDIKKYMTDAFDAVRSLRKTLIDKHQGSEKMILDALSDDTFATILTYKLTGEGLVHMDVTPFIPGASVLDDLTKL